MGKFSRLRHLIGPAIVIVAALLAVEPLVLLGPSKAGDLEFHYISWIDAGHSISAGLLYPHWANSPNFGAGQPQYVFYPPLTWIIGALLGMVMPWGVVPVVMVAGLLMLTGLANRALAKEVIGEHAATVAGCASIFLGYALFCAYKRNDFAEMTGGFWIPLLLLYAMRRSNPAGSLWRRVFDGSTAPLACVVAGAWLSNGPVGIMASYLLAAVAISSAVLERSVVGLIRVLMGTTFGMAVSAVYLLPAVAERKWIDLHNALFQNDYLIENNWLFGGHADPALVAHDAFLHRVSQIAVAMLLIAFVGAAVSWFRGSAPKERRWLLPLALIPPIVLFLLLPVSLPIWNALPELRLLQFPWRWLVVLEAPMSIWFASMVWTDRKPANNVVIAACSIVFLGTIVVAYRFWFEDAQSLVSILEKSAGSGGLIVPGKPEYAPPGIQYSVLNVLVDASGKPLVDPMGKPILDAQGKPLLDSVERHTLLLPDACLLDNAGSQVAQDPHWNGTLADCDYTQWQQLVLPHQPEQKWFAGVAKHAGYLILRLRYFPAWNVRINGVAVKAVAERERGLMAVQVPQGQVEIKVEWATTPDVIAGRWLSGLAVLLVGGLYFFERREMHQNVAQQLGAKKRLASPRRAKVSSKK